MATRFCRVDLSDISRDFRPIAVEPGLALLDRSNANARIVSRWLGRFAAQPEWEEDDSVSFYVCDERGGRLEETVCQPATEDMLQGVLKDELEALTERINKARPETPTERKIYKVLVENLQGLTSDEVRNDLDSYFFRYKDVQGKWRLAWCWGYQRGDQAPAPAVVCTDPECSLLFVRRPGWSPKCPSCEAVVRTGPKRRSVLSRRALVPLLLLLLVAGAGVLLWLNWFHLVATPDEWQGKVGGQVAFKVERKWLFGTKDVTADVVCDVDDKDILQLPGEGTEITALFPGKTELSFHLQGSRSTSVIVRVDPPDNLRIEPGDEIRVGPGKTRQLKLVGEYGNGKQIDLSRVADWTTENSHIASCDKGTLRGVTEGNTTVKVSYRAHAKSKEFKTTAKVMVTDAFDWVVEPSQLDMIVGQVTDLRIQTPRGEPIRITSFNPDVVEVTPTNRLIGRSEGEARIEVAQAGQTKKVDATVTAAQVDRIVLAPAEAEVGVDQTIPVHVWGHVKGVSDPAMNVELAPDWLSAEELPNPRLANFNLPAMELRGVAPTDEGPEKLTVRFDDAVAAAEADPRASMDIRVLRVPVQVVLEPKGPVDVPEGQSVRLQAWAVYEPENEGEPPRRIQILGDRVQWKQDPEPGKATWSGLELRDGAVRALKAGAGPLTIWANYLGRDSNQSVFRSVEPEPIQLSLEVDRNLRIVGEPGQAYLTATGPRGDVELVPDLAQFSSSDANVLEIDAGTGMFYARSPGQVTITAKHPASTEPVSTKLFVFQPEDVAMVFEPDALRLAVDEVGELRLMLQVDDQGTLRTAPLTGPGIRYAMADPSAIDWNPPVAVGRKPTDPGAANYLSAAYLPLGDKTARARIDVLDKAPEAIRVVPSQVKLAPRQVLPLRVEQEVAGRNEWEEVRPDAVAWDVPDGLVFRKATRDLRPTVEVPDGATEPFAVQARFGGQRATCTVTPKEQGPDPASGELELVRSPDGQYLPAGRQQRYQIDVVTGDQREPAASVQWPADFENEFVRWQAPVLTAKQPGYVQHLWAKVGDRQVLLRTVTVEPWEIYGEQPPSGDRPVDVAIISDQGDSVQVPMGAEFDDFRVIATYADGFKRRVTGEAVYSMLEKPQDAPVAARDGKLVGVRPGTTMVQAEFEGVRSKKGLQVAVLADLDIDEIRLTPVQVSLLPNETYSMEAEGFKGGKSRGLITGMPGLQWQSSNPGIVEVTGSSIAARQLGSADVTARLGSLQSGPAGVSVVQSITDALRPDQSLVRMQVGETRRIGFDLIITRGDVDFSRQCQVTPSNPNIVAYDPQAHALVGVRPGVSNVAFASGNKIANVLVEVVPGMITDGRVVIEPSSSTAAVGHVVPLRVFVVTPAGDRIEKTGEATFTSSAPGRVDMVGNGARAMAPGSVEISAQVQGIAQPGVASMTVTSDPIQELIAEPGRMELAVGDRQYLRILGRAACGTHELFPQPDLKVTPDNPPVAVEGARYVAGVAEGDGQVHITWRDQLARDVPVSVRKYALTDLQIDPAHATVSPGQPVVYQVSAMQGNQRRILTPADGLTLYVPKADSGPVVASVEDGTTVRGVNPGLATVVAEIGGQRAEAVLQVAPSGPDGRIAPVNPRARIVWGGHGPRGYREYWDRWGGWHGPGGGGRPGAYVPVGPVVALRFDPDILVLSPESTGATTRVLEVYGNNTYGADVTDKVQLQIENPQVARLKPGTSATFEPGGQMGRTWVTATLGDLKSERPLRIDVGRAMPELARLVVAPDPRVMWVGETGTFGRVEVDPGAGQAPFAVPFRVAAPAGQNVVSVEPDGQNLRGLAAGATRVTVTANQPGGAYDGLSTTAMVYVTEPNQLIIEPDRASLKPGESVRFRVLAQSPDGSRYEVTAPLASIDPNILAADPQDPRRFVARQLGGTQVRAGYGDREAFADVSVTGDRFQEVQINRDPAREGVNDFVVQIEVTGAASEGSLEYRAYLPGTNPPETWTSAQPRGTQQVATLLSPPITRGDWGARYQLILDARPVGGTSIQSYPVHFRLAARVERTNNP